MVTYGAGSAKISLARASTLYAVAILTGGGIIGANLGTSWHIVTG